VLIRMGPFLQGCQCSGHPFDFWGAPGTYASQGCVRHIPNQDNMSVLARTDHLQPGLQCLPVLVIVYKEVDCVYG
jgi:hypothetical protein